MATPTPPLNNTIPIQLMEPKAFMWVKTPGSNNAQIAELPEVLSGSLTDNSFPTNSVKVVSYNVFYDGFSSWDQARGKPTNADGQTVDASNGNQNIVANSYLFNGASFDRQRANTEETILASAARTANTDSADFTNYNAKGAHFIIDVSAITATPEITVTIQGKDSISGNYYDILVGAPISTVGTNVLKIFPGITGSVNASANDILPRTFRVSVAHADADSITYSVSANLIV